MEKSSQARQRKKMPGRRRYLGIEGEINNSDTSIEVSLSRLVMMSITNEQLSYGDIGNGPEDGVKAVLVAGVDGQYDGSGSVVYPEQPLISMRQEPSTGDRDAVIYHQNEHHSISTSYKAQRSHSAS